jgi:serine/threonine-protein kinase
LTFVELLAGVADGLASAHEGGILHRDIKPENILVGKSGYAKLADFGAAKLIGQAERDVARAASGDHTSHGAIIGTVPYMSPEQASGKPIDARSDIFSFGLVLYEALSTRRAFDGRTDQELLQNTIHRQPEPLRKRFQPNSVPSSRKHLKKDLMIGTKARATWFAICESSRISQTRQHYIHR